MYGLVPWALPGRFPLVPSYEQRRKKLFRRWYAGAKPWISLGYEGESPGQAAGARERPALNRAGLDIPAQEEAIMAEKDTPTTA